jgi:hypothetical protein
MSCGARSPLRKHARPDKEKRRGNSQKCLKNTRNSGAASRLSVFFEFHKSCGARSPLRKHARPDKEKRRDNLQHLRARRATGAAAFLIFFEFHKSCGARSPLRKHARPDKEKRRGNSQHLRMHKTCEYEEPTSGTPAKNRTIPHSTFLLS